MESGPIRDFFDREACCAGGGDPRLSPVSRSLLEALEDPRPGDRSVLELGCGMGALGLELARGGASRLHGVDLSPASIEVARERARSAGLEERTSFAVGDAATMALEPHDWVVLDKVICCYPDPDSLLANSLPAARSLYAFSLPASKGWRGALARLLIALENGWRRLRRDPFRAFVHPVEAIEARVGAAGFVPRTVRHRAAWVIEVHERPG